MSAVCWPLTSGLLADGYQPPEPLPPEPLLLEPLELLPLEPEVDDAVLAPSSLPVGVIAHHIPPEALRPLPLT
jgi:hypothetical protein